MNAGIKYRSMAMAIAIVNGNLPNGLPDQSWEADEDSTPRSSDIDNPRSFEIPYHGSCPKCHHLHTNRPLKVSRDYSTVHTRLECDACQHPILGIGRSSTQTTLASVESIPQQPLDRMRGTLGPPHLQICVNTPRAVSQLSSPASPDQISAAGQLSTITEANTLAGRSRSTSNLPVPELNSPGHDNSRTLSTAASPQASVGEDGLPPSGGEGFQQPRTQSSSRFKLKTFLLQGKRRLLKGSRYMKIFGSRKAPSNLPADPPDQPSSKPGFSPRPANSPASHGSMTGVRDTPGEDLNLGGTPLGPPLPDTSEERPFLDFPSEQPPGLVFNPEPPLEPANVVEGSDDPGTQADDHAQAREVKSARIYAKRREATLKREAERKPVCNCRPGCPCLGNDRGSDVDSQGHSRTSSVPVPDISIMTGHDNGNHFLPGADANPNFAGIGSQMNPSQLNVTRNTSITENSSSGADSNRPQTNRLSQATTLWSINDSSTSLAARRSSIPSTMPSHRISARVAPRNYDNVHQNYRLATNPGMADLSTRERAGSVSNDFNQDTSDESSASLSNLPNQGSEQGGRPQPDSVSMSSTEESRVSETPQQARSQERTPRPHSYQAAVDDASNTTPEPAPDQISTALQDHIRAQVNGTRQGSRRGA